MNGSQRELPASTSADPLFLRAAQPLRQIPPPAACCSLRSAVESQTPPELLLHGVREGLYIWPTCFLSHCTCLRSVMNVYFFWSESRWACPTVSSGQRVVTLG